MATTKHPGGDGRLTTEGHLRARLASAEQGLATLQGDLDRARHVNTRLRDEVVRLSGELRKLHCQQHLIDALGRDNDRLRVELAKAHERVRVDAAFEGARRCAERLAADLGHDEDDVEPYVVVPYEPSAGGAS